MIEDRRPTAEDVVAHHDLRGKTAVVTGAGSGLGSETARALASAGAAVVMAVRDVERGEALAAEMRAGLSGTLDVLALDLADLSSVRKAAAVLNDRFAAIDMLVANAGVSKTPEQFTPAGIDVRFATNHLGHFLLAHLLLDRLTAARGRIVVLSSAGHKGRTLDFDDLGWRRRERNDGLAYGESKAANILFATEASRRWAGRGVTVNAVLPGSVFTGLQRYHSEDLKRQIGFIREDGSVNPVMKSVAQGAATSVWAAVAPELAGRGGLILEDCGLATAADETTHPWSGYDPAMLDEAQAARLWEASLEMVGMVGSDA
ncbi:SDR family NAD(P)-dependent oxidoreductase [Sphingomonas bacterium]|uniref:SDR family NAD(P)-dependent oxidoreductase n=1 Tax=Sphingomonas bacterium TaxID=1895847 RepID=UPI0015768C60|nr:SDR family NAD(P)-dependent oxidoreductase [Sphingomonas bacterium]